MQEFSGDLLYIPKRGTCLEDDLRGEYKIWAQGTRVAGVSGWFLLSGAEDAGKAPFILAWVPPAPAGSVLGTRARICG